MGTVARKEVGLGCMPDTLFLQSSVIQNWAVNEYMKKNYRYMKDLIYLYNIPDKGGVRIGMNLVTVSGLIAAAHLAGATHVREFIRSNGKVIYRDGNGTPLTDYLQLNNLTLQLK